MNRWHGLLSLVDSSIGNLAIRKLHPIVKPDHAAIQHEGLLMATSGPSSCGRATSASDPKRIFDVPISQTTVRLGPQGCRGPLALYTPLVKDWVSQPRSGPSIRLPDVKPPCLTCRAPYGGPVFYLDDENRGLHEQVFFRHAFVEVGDKLAIAVVQLGWNRLV